MGIAILITYEEKGKQQQLQQQQQQSNTHTHTNFIVLQHMRHHFYIFILFFDTVLK